MFIEFTQDYRDFVQNNELQKTNLKAGSRV